MEEWKIIKGFEHYEVSNKGRVRSSCFSVVRKNGRKYTHKGRVVAQKKDKDGYQIVQLYVNKNRYIRKVHRLVYEAFIGDIPNDLVVDHINNNRADNNASNLQLLSNADNLRKDAWRSKKHKLPLGVSLSSSKNGYVANISIDGVYYYLGLFSTSEEASDAYNAARLNYDERGVLPQKKTNLKVAKHKVIDNHKICSCCGENLPVSHFYIVNGKPTGACRECTKRRRLYYYYNKKEKP